MVSSDRQTVQRAHSLQSTGLLPFPLGRVSRGETRVAVMETQCSLILNGISVNTTNVHVFLGLSTSVEGSKPGVECGVILGACFLQERAERALWL